MLNIFSRKVDFSLSSITGFNCDEFLKPDFLTSEPNLLMISALYRSSPPFIALAQEVSREDSRPYHAVEAIAYKLQAGLKDHDRALKVRSVKIHRINDDFVRLLASHEVSILDDRYIFMQNLQKEVPRNIYETVFDIQAKGFKPVLVFPGRDPFFKNNKARLIKLIHRNCLFQIDIHALTGNYGPEARETAEFLLEQQSVKFVSWQVGDLSRKSKNNSIRVTERIAELLTRLAARELIVA